MPEQQFPVNWNILRVTSTVSQEVLELSPSIKCAKRLLHLKISSISSDNKEYGKKIFYVTETLR